MARITAQQAYTRARAKLQKTRQQNSKTLTESRNKYLNRLSNMGIAIKSSTSTEDGTEHPTFQPTSSTRKRRKQIVSNNRKITDYYLRQSRGRENIPKRRSVESDCEVITLDESDNEQCNAGTHDSTPPTTPRLVVKPESDGDQSNLSPGFETSFADLNVSKFVIADDIEIVEMLPPIPLRKHSVIDLDD